MKIRIFSTILLSAALAVSAFAADITGKWKATTEFNGQTRENTLNLKADGANLTGTMENQRGSSEIKEGKIDGDNISFTVVRNFQGTERKVQYKGVVAGDEINLTTTMGDREIKMTAKRVK